VLLLPQSALALDPEKGLSECTVVVWGLRDGLSGTMVRRIAQTPDGYLWIAAFGAISRFDGARSSPRSFPLPGAGDGCARANRRSRSDVKAVAARAFGQAPKVPRRENLGGTHRALWLSSHAS
jgi:ligand-binding sensor domain-containing protein